MSPARERIAWASCAALLVVANAVEHRVERSLAVDSVAIALPSAIASPAPVDEDSLQTLVDTIAESDLFRLGRREAESEVAPVVQRPPPPPPAAAPRPRLVLRGLVGGPPWNAIVEGFPGRPATTVVREGDVVGDLTVKSVRRDVVIVAARDTLWTLRWERP